MQNVGVVIHKIDVFQIPFSIVVKLLGTRGERVFIICSFGVSDALCYSISAQVLVNAKTMECVSNKDINHCVTVAVFQHHFTLSHLLTIACSFTPTVLC